MKILCLLMSSTLVFAQYKGLPDWAADALNASTTVSKPKADIWRILDETRITVEKGSLFTERRLVQLVLNERGSEEAAIFLADGTEGSRKILKLKGWHLKPSGALNKLDRDNVVTIGEANYHEITYDTTTLAYFDHVSKGSIIVFQSREQESSFLGPLANIPVVSGVPILKRTIRLEPDASNKFDLYPRQFEAWGLDAAISTGTITVHNVPALDDDTLLPWRSDHYPSVMIKGRASQESEDRYQTWDHLARWYHKLFITASGISETASTTSVDMETLKQSLNELQTKVRYKQVYLDSSRSWTPSAGDEVMRRAYGDCKDMVACLARSGGSNFRVTPALANIENGPDVGPDDLVYPAFNHLIAAIRLPQSLGLASEIEIDNELYLLIDPTAKDTALGKLPFTFRNRQVMICQAEGARWVLVPDSALEAGEVTVKLTGTLDLNKTLVGSIDVLESGNVHGLRTASRAFNDRDIQDLVRDALDLPPVVRLSNGAHRVTDTGDAKLTYQVYWPSFLARDADGFRLPSAIVQGARWTLTKGDESRYAPVAFRGFPKTTWSLDIHSETLLRPGQAEFKWESETRSFNWQCDAQSRLKLIFELQGQEKVFLDQADREAGEEAWRDYRQNYNAFFKNVAILRAI